MQSENILLIGHYSAAGIITYYMKVSPFTVSIFAVAVTTLLVIIISVAAAANCLTFEAEFYFVCYSVEDNALSASSVSDAVSNYGGAGYVIEHSGKYYVTVSCYYEEKNANAVCESLKRKNLDCEVLKIETGDYPLPASANRKLYLGNFNTLFSLSTLAYECANSLDTGDYGQINAKNVICDIKKGLNGLLNSNTDNCFARPLKRLISLSEEAGGGIIHSKDLRKLQIAITDCIINIQLR